MRSVVLALLILAAPTLALATPVTADPSEKQIRGALNEMHQAASTLDADRFMGWYLHDPALTITFDGQILRGWESIRDQQRRWWSGPMSKPSYTEDMPPEVRLLSPGVATTLQSMTITGGAASGGNKRAHLVVTSVWKRFPDGWRIVIAHESLVR